MVCNTVYCCFEEVFILKPYQHKFLRLNPGRFNPCKDAQKVSFSPSACLLCLFESANDQQNKQKLSRTYVVVAMVPTSVQVSRSYDIFFVDFVAELLEMIIS